MNKVCVEFDLDGIKEGVLLGTNAAIILLIGINTMMIGGLYILSTINLFYGLGFMGFTTIVMALAFNQFVFKPLENKVGGETKK